MGLEEVLKAIAILSIVVALFSAFMVLSPVLDTILHDINWSLGLDHERMLDGRAVSTVRGYDVWRHGLFGDSAFEDNGYLTILGNGSWNVMGTMLSAFVIIYLLWFALKVLRWSFGG